MLLLFLLICINSEVLKLPKDVLAGTASLLIQKETQDKTTIMLQGM